MIFLPPLIELKKNLAESNGGKKRGKLARRVKTIKRENFSGKNKSEIN